MSSIVIELQREALDSNIKVSDLLRKAFVVSRKLKLQEFQEWVENELNGYKDETPEYRVASGQLKGWNPYNGWVPVIIQDSKKAELLSKRANGQSIAELEKISAEGDNAGPLHMPLPQATQRQLSSAFGYETEISLFVQPTTITKVIDTIRNIILNWALNLEEDGILGENLSFSEKEKENATRSVQNINNFYGPVDNSQIAQGNHELSQTISHKIDMIEVSKFIQSLKEQLTDIEVSAPQKLELESDISTLNAQIESPNPKKGIITESLTSIKRILEGASGSAAGQLLIEAGKMFFG